MIASPVGGSLFKILWDFSSRDHPRIYGGALRNCRVIFG